MDLKLASGQYITTGKLDAFTQLHIARKLGPALPIIEGLVDKENEKKDKTILVVVALSKLGDVDTEYVIKKSLSVVSRKSADGQLFKVQSADGHMMYDDITLSDLIKLTIEVIEENIGDFFRDALNILQVESK